VSRNANLSDRANERFGFAASLAIACSVMWGAYALLGKWPALGGVVANVLLAVARGVYAWGVHRGSETQRA